MYSIIGLTFIIFFSRSQYIPDSRLAIFIWGISSIISLIFFRIFIFRNWYIFHNQNKSNRSNILIVGANIAAKNLVIQLEFENIYGFKIVGFVEDTIPVGGKIFEQYKNIGHTTDIPVIVKQYLVDEILITLSDVSLDRLLNVFDICKSTSAIVKSITPLLDIVHGKVSTELYFNTPVLRLTNGGRDRISQLIKRTIDIVGSIFSILVFAIPFIIISLIIKLTSKGPVLYSQIRIGKNGKPFKFYKFRSMYIDSDKDKNREHQIIEFIKGNTVNSKTINTKIVNESNITSIGKILRRTSVDELPQVICVLKGDMSLVGPRPCLPYEFKAYGEWQKRRLSVLPGCTGLWQVSSRSEGGYDDMVLLDLYYIDNISPWFDLQLILKTIPVMLFSKGGK